MEKRCVLKTYCRYFALLNVAALLGCEQLRVVLIFIRFNGGMRSLKIDDPTEATLNRVFELSLEINNKSRRQYIYRFLFVKIEFYNYDMHFYLKTISIADKMAK